ncbi:hypothetical protein AZI86_11610 [Bdellovibrio bacteriovorus]|uniref:Bdellovibrio beta-sandwich domain-containing protein n=1 Tax=Bdellovibrio bacteriovorus TaxID=959 RepID=A0A150WLS7_BDEBC|nr:beta-sandwich domain-containing protein [Bdellovibrio bacteriovorus]KYG64842.1 hypothetical protein AZI86_11610 [Bdellovibrio bacteriovorus]
MKTSVIISSLVAISLTQGWAYAQVYDLPEPGGGASITPAQVLPFDMSDVQYAGSLRLGRMSRKEEGTQYRVLLEPVARLQKMDLRMAFGKARVREAWLVTESGNRIEISKYRATGVLEASTLYSSENFSLNENIKEVQLLGEAFSDDAEIIVTAVSENVLPKLTLWKAPVEVNASATSSYEMDRSVQAQPTAVRQGNCVNGFCIGDVVIYMRNRGKLVEINRDGRVVLIQRGIRKIVKTSQLQRPLIAPYTY